MIATVEFLFCMQYKTQSKEKWRGKKKKPQHHLAPIFAPKAELPLFALFSTLLSICVLVRILRCCQLFVTTSVESHAASEAAALISSHLPT